MTALLTDGALFIGILIGLAASSARRRRRRLPQLASTRQILLPFMGTALSRRALEAAIRLAKVDAGARASTAKRALRPGHDVRRRGPGCSNDSGERSVRMTPNDRCLSLDLIGVP